MRIAQVSPLIESVPPRFYGGTERVVSYLTEQLVRDGHEVTLFASGDSQTSARLQPVCERALRRDPASSDGLPHQILAIERVLQRAHEFDIIHFHSDFLHWPVFRRHPTPTLTTLHGRLDLPDLIPLYQEFQDMPVNSISHNQREPMPWLDWQATVYHGLPKTLLRFTPQPELYVAFIGRICPEKRPDLAILIAREAGVPIRIAAKVDRVDQDYFSNVVAPLLNDSDSEYIGEISESEKSDFVGRAMAVLMPIDWPEPFGLTIIEAMACGTPTIAYRRGSVPELIDDGVTGFIVDNVDQAAKSIERAADLDRDVIRTQFEQRFRVERMAGDYVAAYERLTEASAHDRRVA